MIDRGFVDAIRQIAVDANRPDVISVGGEDDHYYLLLNRSTNTYEQRVKRKTRVHQLASIPTLAAFVADRGDEDSSVRDVWYNRDRVVVRYLNVSGGNPANVVEEPNHRAVLALDLSEAMARIVDWKDGADRMQQVDFARMLRTTFRGMYSPANLLDSVSHINWVSSDNGQSVTGQTSRSVGREIEARADGRIALPETVLFTVPVWETGGPEVTAIRVKVGCVLEVNPATKDFSLIPFGGAVEDQLATAEGQVGRLVADALASAVGKAHEIPVFFGSPWETGD